MVADRNGSIGERGGRANGVVATGDGNGEGAGSAGKDSSAVVGDDRAPGKLALSTMHVAERGQESPVGGSPARQLDDRLDTLEGDTREVAADVTGTLRDQKVGRSHYLASRWWQTGVPEESEEIKGSDTENGDHRSTTRRGGFAVLEREPIAASLPSVSPSSTFLGDSEGGVVGGPRLSHRDGHSGSPSVGAGARAVVKLIIASASASSSQH